MNTQINPYLSFDGDCREAMKFYQECLGGELSIQTIGESPIAEQFPEESKNKIMHAGLIKDNLVVLASDTMNSKNEIVRGNSVSLCINCSNEQEINTFFSKLSLDGTITHPLENTFWNSTFGIVKDKFGVTWMLNYEKNQN